MSMHHLSILWYCGSLTLMKHHVTPRSAVALPNSVTVEQRSKGGASKIIGGCHYMLHAAASTRRTLSLQL